MIFDNKPIIGIVGGIGSGKSYVAKLFTEQGCLLVDSDAQVREAYENPAVRRALEQWWGKEVFRADDSINRSFIASQIFTDPTQRQRLEGLLHPLVSAAREKQMRAAVGNPQVLAFVWDTPLLVETAMDRECDVIVFVEAPEHVRQERVGVSRRWTLDELARREKSQTPLDKKREISDYVVVNTAEADDEVRGQVREILSRILSNP